MFLLRFLRFMSNKSSSNKINFDHYVKSYQSPIFPPKQIDLSKIARADAIKEVAEILEAGGCVALPTDTVYGLVTLLKFSPKLFYVKKRVPTKPVALFIASPESIKQYAEQSVDDDLLHQLLPGRCTLLFRRLSNHNDSFHFNNDLIGFRIPDDSFIQELCKQFDEPLAQTSANLSGEPSAIRPEEFSAIWETIDLIVTDSDRTLDEERKGSTIIDLSVPNTYHIKREGRSLLHYKKILRESNLIER